MNLSSHKNANKRIGLIVLGVGSVFSIFILILLFALGDKELVKEKSQQSDDIIDLLRSPSKEHTDSKDFTSTDIGLELPKGGWTYQTDSLGNISSQYRCESLDPNPPLLPDGWIEMQKPEVEMHLSDNKVVVITGDLGIANAPNRILESGEISGHVHVSMYELGNQNNRLGLEPTMVLTTPQANFDNYIGEITCDSEVRIVSSSQTLVGRRLSVRFNDKEERVEYVRLEELDYLEFYPEKNKPFKPIQVPNKTAKTNIKQPLISRTKTTTHHKIRAAAIGPDIVYYLLTFSDNVKIVQGKQHEGRFASGDRLTVAFSGKSDSSTISRTPNIKTPTNMLPYGIQTTLVATALASAPTTSEPPVRLTCEGGLTMVPLQDNTLIPSSPEDTRIELIADNGSSVHLYDNEQGLTATGSTLRYGVIQDRADLFGSPATLFMNDMNTTSNHLWVAQNIGTGGAVGAGSTTSSASSGNTSLVWNEGVDFFFDSEGGDGALQEVICNGDVLLSDDGSTVACETLTVRFEKDAKGSSAPTLAIATGGVKAISDTQTLWSNEAEVTFISGKSDSSKEESMFGGSKADTMHAKGDVQVLLDDGGRAFCNTLEGNIAQDTVQLNGDVVIAYKRMLMNRGDSATLALNRNKGTGKWLGSGQALFLDEPLDVSPDNRIERPVIQTDKPNLPKSNNISMRANWNESMLLDRTFNNDAGAVNLIGNVDVRSQRNQYERSMMTGNDLRLEFQIENKENAKENRKLQTVIARNDAKIEHRLWDKLKPEEKPVVYFIGGDHIEFEADTLETMAVGTGVLLLRDPREQEGETHQSSIAGRGITRFTWDEKLKTTKINETLYRIQMNGNVQMHHVGLDGSVGKLTSNQIDAIALDPNKVETNDQGSSELVLRGMDLQQLEAEGNVYVETSTHAVECDEFDYNLRTGIATLTATADRTVAIHTQESPYPVRASSIVWNMDPAIDTIRILHLQGSSPH